MTKEEIKKLRKKYPISVYTSEEIKRMKKLGKRLWKILEKENE